LGDGTEEDIDGGSVTVDGIAFIEATHVARTISFNQEVMTPRGNIHMSW
jgi:hypothetical protein